MDARKRRAIEACGECGQPERDHQYPPGTSPEDIAVMRALGGPCGQYRASDAAVIYQKYLAITDNRAPGRQPDTGRIGKRLPLHQACGHRHQPGSCPFQSGVTPGPDAARQGAARAREALGLTRPDDAEARHDRT
jgi:hypothetical protein